MLLNEMPMGWHRRGMRDLKVLKLRAKESKHQVKKKQIHYSNPGRDAPVLQSPLARNRKRLPM